jgi:hypothetical protein
MKQSDLNFCTLHTMSAVHMYMDFVMFNFSDNISCFILPFILCNGSNSVHVNLLIVFRRWPDLFCNNYHIHRVCNHSAELAVIF